MEPSPVVPPPPIPPQQPVRQPVQPTHQLKSKLPLLILLIILIAAASVFGGYYYANHYGSILPPFQRACTMEAKLCPDGSSVGRTGPNCEFAHCPTATPNPTANWKTYTTTDNKLTFKVPENLDVNQKITHVIYIGSNIIKDPDSADQLVISYTTDGTTPPGYSGTSAGDRTDDGSIIFMGKSIPKVKLVFQGKTTDVFYGGGPGTTNLVKIGQAQFIISTSWGLASKNGMPKSTEDIFDQILCTFTFTQ